MKNMKKLIVKIVAITAIVLIVAAIGIVLYIDSIARRGVEYAATFALGVNTQLKSMHIGLLNGQVSLGGLNVANPLDQGFTSDHFLTLNQGRVEVSLGSLMKDQVVVPELTLSGLDMNLEKKNGKANYQVILDNLSGGEKAKDQPKPEPSTKGGKKFIVNELTLSNIVIHADLLPVGGSLTKASLTIPEIKLQNIGSESKGGVVLSDLSGIIIQAIMQAVVDKGAGLPGDMVNELGNGLKGLKGLGDAGAKVLKGAGDELGKTLDKGAKDIGKGLGNLFGGKDKKKDEK